MPRCRLPSPKARPIRLNRPSNSPARARCRMAGSAGGNWRDGSLEEGCGPRPPGGWYLAIGFYCAPFRDHPVPCLRVRQVNAVTGARLVVLVSGEGTNLQALIDACRAANYGARVVAVGADRD